MLLIVVDGGLESQKRCLVNPLVVDIFLKQCFNYGANVVILPLFP